MNNLFELINEYEIITIFRHTNPDPDALGSQLGLKYWILENFDNKKVYILGNSNTMVDIFSNMDEVDVSIIKNSLAVVLDTANSFRVDDNRFKLAKKVVKIDHHLEIEKFGDINIVDTNASATSELLATIFLSLNSRLNTKIAEYLYMGILADTNAFKNANTTSKTLSIASKLSEYNLDLSRLNRAIFDKSKKDYFLLNKISNKMIFDKDNKFGYIFISNRMIKNSGRDANQIRAFVNSLSSIKELEIWCIITEELDSNNKKIYSGSIRSKNIVINKICEKYNGGGHKLACGVARLTKDQYINLIEDLKALID